MADLDLDVEGLFDDDTHDDTPDSTRLSRRTRTMIPRLSLSSIRELSHDGSHCRSPDFAVCLNTPGTPPETRIQRVSCLIIVVADVPGNAV